MPHRSFSSGYWPFFFKKKCLKCHDIAVEHIRMGAIGSCLLGCSLKGKSQDKAPRGTRARGGIIASSFPTTSNTSRRARPLCRGTSFYDRVVDDPTVRSVTPIYELYTYGLPHAWSWFSYSYHVWLLIQDGSLCVCLMPHKLRSAERRSPFAL